MIDRPYNPEGTVESIVTNGLCTQCGFCEPVCPTGAITIDEHGPTSELLPVVDPTLCIMCPLCLEVCPGETVDFDQYFRSYLNTTDYQKYTGYIDKTFIAWARDTDFRHEAASGGVISTLAQFALTRSIVDYVIFARPKQDDPFRTETLITDDPADFNRSHGSIYYPVPLGEGLNRLFEYNIAASSKLCLVGLPCHIHGAHKLFDTGRFKRYKWELLFGLFCGGTWTYKAVDTYLKDRNLGREDVSNFSFRGDGWPGKIMIRTKDNREIKESRQEQTLVARINRSTIFSASSFFTPHRCLTCSDGLADLADISFGDPWLKSQKGETIGKTLVVTRTSKGLALLRAAADNQVIDTEEIAKDLAIASQKSMLTFKQNYAAFNYIISKISDKKVPRYNYKWISTEAVPRSTYTYAAVSYLCYVVGLKTSSKYFRIPVAIIRGVIARLIKRRLVQLTDYDDQNYFR